MGKNLLNKTAFCLEEPGDVFTSKLDITSPEEVKQRRGDKLGNDLGSPVHAFSAGGTIRGQNQKSGDGSNCSEEAFTMRKEDPDCKNFSGSGEVERRLHLPWVEGGGSKRRLKAKLEELERLHSSQLRLIEEAFA